MNQKLFSFILVGAILGIAYAAGFFAYPNGSLFLAQDARAATSSSSGQTVSVTVLQSLTMTLATSTIPLGSLSPGVPIIGTTSTSVSTNNSNGWNLTLNRASSSSTLIHSDLTTLFPDFTPAWDDSAPNSVIASSIGAKLSFRTYQTGTDAALYSSTWWGTDDTAPNAKWGGTPTTGKKIANVATYVGTAQAVIYGVRADAPATQKAGAYSGSITMTALVNP